MRKWLTYLLLLPACILFSQSGSTVFNDTIIHTLYIESDLPDWFATLEQEFQLNLSDPENHPEIYHKCNVTFDGLVINDCGFREKGNASNTLTNLSRKKPLKISFNEFIDQDFDGLKKINLNNFTNDPSLMHDVIANKLMRDAGLFASRTSYTKVWVNNEYIGLYVIIENVDKTFLKNKYGSAFNDGNLYKTDRGAAVFLDWLGNDPATYKKAGLKLTTNETADDWSKILNFIDFLNHNFDDDFKQQLEKRFDVHAYLKVLAVEKCISSWDSYWGGGNNYYLYEHPDGKYRWIPWDMNETFQDIKMLSGTSLLNGYLIPTPQLDKRPLIKRIFEFEDYKTEYLNNVCDLIHNNFTLEHLGQFIVDRHNLVDETYKNDPNRYNQYNSFSTSLTEYNKDEVSITKSGYVLRINYPGIFPFIQTQREWAVEQIKAWEQDCSINDNSLYNLNIYPHPANDFIQISNITSGFEFAQFRIYDFTGRLVKITDYEVTEGKSYKLFISELPAGMYLLMKHSADSKRGRAKLIKQ